MAIKFFSTAQKNGKTVEDYAAENSVKVPGFFVNKLNITYTDVIRTTDPDHIRRCQEIWQKLAPIFILPNMMAGIAKVVRVS